MEPVTIEDFVQWQELTTDGSCTSSEFGETHWFVKYEKNANFGK